MTECKSMVQLKQMLMKQIQAAAKEALDKSYHIMQKNVDQFYLSPSGEYYKRSFQMKESPHIDYLVRNGDKVAGQVSMDTSKRYNPSGRDTETIYTFAENGRLEGKGGFWQRTVDEIDKIVKDVFRGKFSEK